VKAWFYSCGRRLDASRPRLHRRSYGASVAVALVTEMFESSEIGSRAADETLSYVRESFVEADNTEVGVETPGPVQFESNLSRGNKTLKKESAEEKR
jgi:hypothetical protein